jgi:hypothetical protein
MGGDVGTVAGEVAERALLPDRCKVCGGSRCGVRLLFRSRQTFTSAVPAPWPRMATAPRSAAPPLVAPYGDIRAHLPLACVARETEPGTCRVTLQGRQAMFASCPPLVFEADHPR